MSLTEIESQWIAWHFGLVLHKLDKLKGHMSANSDAIESAVSDLKAAETRIHTKLDALQAAVDAGEDLSGPIADLRAEATSVGSIAPEAVVAPADPAVPVVRDPAPDAPPAAPADGNTPVSSVLDPTTPVDPSGPGGLGVTTPDAPPADAAPAS